MNARFSANIGSNISRNVAGNAINSALRLYVGRGREFSVKMLSNMSGVPDRVIECAMCHPEDPDYRPLKPEALLSIAGILGPGFTTAMLKPINQAAYMCDKREVEPGALVADCAADTCEIATRAADGHFDINDRHALRLVGQRQVERGMLLVAMSA
jgi:hypothetical protein